ncbi:MAG TPA: DUF5686 and carboxypeptidase regulatory-like domain-containing protein [Bacteroidales bacterium]|nr:DUF5686 and carboxypeptidase regulatory-like domain-containing protein [Bacteroidales bacterium]
MKTQLLIVTLLVIGNIVTGQGIKGIIKDTKKQPVPFATIYIEDLQTGTTANQNGEYEIKAQPGKYKIIFRALGFKSQKQEVEVASDMKQFDVTLETEVYQMKEVVISNKSEDPAYGVMRKAIAYAPFHLREVDKFKSSVYLRGTVYVDKIPKLISKFASVSDGKNEYKIKTGDVYVEESVIDMEFTAPRFFKQKVTSLRSTFPGESNNPINPVMTIIASFYQSEILDMISPLSPQAFQHYKFKYLGFFQDGEHTVDKIQVIPRRKSQELFDGYIYIVEGRWCIHSVDLNNTQYWGTMNLKEIYSIVDNKAWMPVSYNFTINAKIMGMRGRYKYNSSVKYTDVKLNEKLVAQFRKNGNAADMDAKKKTDLAKTQAILAKERITNREMKKASQKIEQLSYNEKLDTITPAGYKELTKRETDTLARKRDTSYWAEFRPVPLTAEEIKSFDEGPQSVLQKVKKDSIYQSKDTTGKPRKENRLWFIMGKTFKSEDKKSWFRYGGLIQPEQLAFNTVDGFRYGLSSNLSLRLDSAGRLNITPWVGYAFNRKALMWAVNTQLIYLPQQKGILELNIGEQSRDFSQSDGMPGFMNSVYSLFLRKNYQKLYNTRYIELKHNIRLHKAFQLSSNIMYERINELDNHSDYSFFYRNSREYTPNIPVNLNYQSLNGSYFRNFVVSNTLSFTPQRKPRYDISKNYRRTSPSISLGYDIGLNGILNSDSKFQKISMGINQHLWFTRDREIEYKLKGSYWLNSDKVYFSSFSHVKSYDLPVSFSQFGGTFQHLPFYVPNTNEWLFEGYFNYSTKLLVLKRLPLISNKIWTENIYLNYMHSPAFKHHMELGYGLGQIWAVGEIGVFSAFDNWKYSATGLKISIGFN